MKKLPSLAFVVAVVSHACTAQAPRPMAPAIAASMPVAATARRPARASPSHGCSDAEFWDGGRCVVKKEVLGAEDVNNLIARCRRGDDQACPLALYLYQHDCDLDDVRACSAGTELAESWDASRSQAWVDERCRLGQAAACWLAGRRLKQQCLADVTTSCAALAHLYDRYPELEAAMDAGRQKLLQRACELGDSAACDSDASVGGLGLAPQSP